jgi:Animal haem peroxidase
MPGPSFNIFSTPTDVKKALTKANIKFTAKAEQIAAAIKAFKPENALPIDKLSDELRQSIPALRPSIKRFHGAKIALGWFPGPALRSPCANKFGYMSPVATRNSSKLPFDVATQALLGQLGALMADPSRASGPDSIMPAGYTYFGQFVDHDITLDVSSSLDVATDATTLHNMRTPALDLDSLYGRGPALDPFLYEFPATNPATAIKFQMGSNRNFGNGGPGGAGGFGGMIAQTRSDVPRNTVPSLPSASTNTAIIGDPRNDENLIVSQFHHSMLRFHNKVVDLLVLAAFAGDIFVEAKRIVTHHYQWAVVNDYLKRICGTATVTASMSGVTAAIDSPFAMPVEFSVAAYRFGHSQIRNNYWVNFVQINASLGQVFDFARNPNLPVLSNWVVDFNAFFTTGFSVPVNNKAKKIDSVLAAGLTSLPGFSGAMAALATRNLRRAQALGLPSGQAMATQFGIAPMTDAQLKQGLPANEIAILDSAGGVLKTKTPLWYYCLREAMVLKAGESLGPVGGKIVADTFVRMLKRDAGSYLNATTPFAPFLPSAVAGDFTVADLVNFAGVTVP